MKSILLHANPDSGLEARLHCAFSLLRRFQARLTCIHVTPYEVFTTGDPFGGVYALPNMIDQFRRNADEHRQRTEERLRAENVEYEWVSVTGAPAQSVVEQARFCDLILVGRPGDDHPGRSAMVPDLLVHARQPVLVVPDEAGSETLSGPAIIAWNGSLEAANALRQSLPLLKQAPAISVVTVGEQKGDFPAEMAVRYLALHGLRADPVLAPPAGRSFADSLLPAAEASGASLIVMGAYGHTRLREAVLGGATRDMLYRSERPLLLAH